MQRCITLLALM